MRLEQPPLQLNQTAPCGAGDGFSTADDVHLGEDAFHVRLHCALTNEKRRAYLLIAFSLGHQLENVDLSRTQSFAADAFGQLRGEMHWNTRFTGVYAADAIH